MSVVYLDSSAFVKLFVEEPGTDELRRFLRTVPTRRVASVVMRTEAVRVARRIGPEALSVVRAGLRRVDLLAMDDRALDAAADLEPPSVRTLDAIHIATAMALGDDLETIVTYDLRMADAARALGLPVASPGA